MHQLLEIITFFLSLPFHCVVKLHYAQKLSHTWCVTKRHEFIKQHTKSTFRCTQIRAPPSTIGYHNFHGHNNYNLPPKSGTTYRTHAINELPQTKPSQPYPHWGAHKSIHHQQPKATTTCPSTTTIPPTQTKPQHTANLQSTTHRHPSKLSNFSNTLSNALAILINLDNHLVCNTNQETIIYASWGQKYLAQQET